MSKPKLKFQNKKGELMDLNPSLKIKDLLELGFKDIKLVEKHDPWKKGEWRNINESGYKIAKKLKETGESSI